MRRLLLLCLLALPCLAQAPHQVVLTWVAPTTNTDGSAIVGPLTYTIYQYVNATEATTKVVTGVTGLTYIVTGGLITGAGYTFHVTCTNAQGLESGAGNAAVVTIPGVAPNPPTNLVGTAT